MWKLLFAVSITAFASEITVDLQNPTYKNGILFTHQGGVIKNKEIRIQAENIQYIHRFDAGKEVHKIEAEGSLLVQYKGRAYVGSELEYDFLTKQAPFTTEKHFPPFGSLEATPSN